MRDLYFLRLRSDHFCPSTASELKGSPIILSRHDWYRIIRDKYASVNSVRLLYLRQFYRFKAIYNLTLHSQIPSVTHSVDTHLTLPRLTLFAVSGKETCPEGKEFRRLANIVDFRLQLAFPSGHVSFPEAANNVRCVSVLSVTAWTATIHAVKVSRLYIRRFNNRIKCKVEAKIKS